jgi:scyllo-inositol 2-dehydrogenase (NADP+)
MCVRAAEVDSLLALATDRGLRLGVFHNRRWDSDFLTIRKLLDAGALGKVHTYAARWDRFRPQIQDRWKDRPGPGAGLLHDLGSHLIDQVLCLFGRPEWVQADVFAQRPASQVSDGFEILMGKGRLRITLGGSLFAADPRLRYRINGEHAAFVKNGIDPQEDQLRAGSDPLLPEFGAESADIFGTLTRGSDGSRATVPSVNGRWLTFYEGMRQSIERNIPVPVAAADAREVLEVIEAAIESSNSGRRIAL